MNAMNIFHRLKGTMELAPSIEPKPAKRENLGLILQRQKHVKY